MEPERTQAEIRRRLEWFGSSWKLYPNGKVHRTYPDGHIEVTWPKEPRKPRKPRRRSDHPPL